jgi:hypothetical protein
VRRAHSLPEAVLRVRALIAVLDEDLRIPGPAVSLPERLDHLTGRAAVEARSALRFLAHSVEKLELYLDDARQSADGWRRRSSAAFDRGEYFLAAQARQRAAEAEKDLELYEQEIAAARQLLKQCSEAEFDWTKP